MPINTVRCPSCGARVNHVLRTKDIPEREPDAKVAEVSCPRCKGAFPVTMASLSERVREDVRDLRDFDRRMGSSEDDFKELFSSSAEDTVESALKLADEAFARARRSLDEIELESAVHAIDAERLLAQYWVPDVERMSLVGDKKPKRQRKPVPPAAAAVAGAVAVAAVKHAGTAEAKKSKETAAAVPPPAAPAATTGSAVERKPDARMAAEKPDRAADLRKPRPTGQFPDQPVHASSNRPDKSTPVATPVPAKAKEQPKPAPAYAERPAAPQRQQAQEPTPAYAERPAAPQRQQAQEPAVQNRPSRPASTEAAAEQRRQQLAAAQRLQQRSSQQPTPTRGPQAEPSRQRAKHAAQPGRSAKGMRRRPDISTTPPAAGPSQAVAAPKPEPAAQPAGARPSAPQMRRGGSGTMGMMSALNAAMKKKSNSQ